MRLKIDLEIPNWTKWLMGGLVFGVIVGVVAARVYAETISVKTNFANGETLSASDMNANFKTLQDAVNQAAPPGTVVAYAGAIPPEGWLPCDGTEKSRAQYASLFAAINTIHGDGNGSSTFNVPDYRGRFLRGVDGAAGRDLDKGSREKPTSDSGYSGNAVGSIQSDAMQGHWHEVRFSNPSGAGAYFGPAPAGTAGQGPNGDPGTSTNLGACAMTTDPEHGSVRVASESRPKNAYVNYIIKY